MRKTWILIPGVVFVAAVATWQLARTTRSSSISAFGISMAHRPVDDTYFDAAQAALDRWLTAEGYRPPVPCPNPAFGIHGGTETSQAYVASEGATEPVTLVVSRETKTGSGLRGTLMWEYSGFSWVAEQHQSLAMDEAHRIGVWWDSYLQKNPRP